MDITYNKVDQTPLPLSQNRVNASEYNQIAGSLMHIITTSGLTPDSQDNAQLLTALQSMEIRIVETYQNGASWYRIWSNGWCEQGGHFAEIASAAPKTVNLLKAYTDTNYNIQVSFSTTGNAFTSNCAASYFTACNKTTSSFDLYSYTDTRLAEKDWKAEGFIS